MKQSLAFRLSCSAVVACTLMGSAIAASSSSASSKATVTLTPDQQYLLCMQKYVKKREDFIQLSMTGYYKYMTDALNKRETGIMSAWALTNANSRKSSLNATWKNFGQTWRIANNQLKDLRTKAWRQYRLDIVQCGPKAQDEESGGLGMDSSF